MFKCLSLCILVYLHFVAMLTFKREEADITYVLRLTLFGLQCCLSFELLCACVLVITYFTTGTVFCVSTASAFHDRSGDVFSTLSAFTYFF